MKSEISPASLGGCFHLLFPVTVQSATGTLNDGALPLIEESEIFKKQKQIRKISDRSAGAISKGNGDRCEL